MFEFEPRRVIGICLVCLQCLFVVLEENGQGEELGKCCILFIEIYVNVYFSYAFWVVYVVFLS